MQLSNFGSWNFYSGSDDTVYSVFQTLCHGLIHDWYNFLLFKIGLRPIIKGWVNGTCLVKQEFRPRSLSKAIV